MNQRSAFLITVVVNKFISRFLELVMCVRVYEGF
jgi:hypothetical protein